MAIASGRNIRWVAISRAAALLSQLCGLLIFGRYLAAEEFGVVAIAFAIMNFAALLRDFGTSAAVIQKSSISERAKHAVFALNNGLGALLAIVLVAAAGLLARLFGVSELRPVLWLLAIGFPLTTVSLLHQALLERDSQFQRIAMIELSSTLVGLLLGVLSARSGWGAYALVVQSLTTAGLASAQLLLASTWKIHVQTLRELTREDFRQIVPFGSRVAAASLFNYAARNFDVLIIANLLGAAAAGYYSIAARLMLFPLQSVTFVMARALFPVMSRCQHDGVRVRTMFVHVIASIAVVTAAMMGLLWSLRNELISTILGGRWAEVGDLLFWLAPAGFIQSIASIAGVLLMSLAATTALVRLSVITAILYLGAFAIGGFFSLKVASQLYFWATLVNSVTVLLTLKVVVGIDVGRTLAAAMRPAAIACAMAALLVSFPQYLPIFGSGRALLLAALGLTFYLSGAALLFRNDLANAWHTFGTRKE